MKRWWLLLCAAAVAGCDDVPAHLDKKRFTCDGRVYQIGWYEGWGNSWHFLEVVKDGNGEEVLIPAEDRRGSK